MRWKPIGLAILFAQILFLLLIASRRVSAQSCALDVMPGSPVTFANESVTYCSLTVSAGATLVIGGAVTVNVTGNVDIEGTVDGFGNGYGSTYAPTAGPGAGGAGTGGNGGGGHGGAGGNGGEFSSGAGGGSAYDNPSNPVLMGSAGGENTSWGPPQPYSGGAAFLLTDLSGTVSINGIVDMSGDGGTGPGSSGGGGAGGTISIQALVITLNGTVSANGGSGGTNSGGGGGGIILLCPMVDPLSGSGSYLVTGGGGGANSNGILYGGSLGNPGIYTVCNLPTPTPTSTETPTPTQTPTSTPTIPSTPTLTTTPTVTSTSLPDCSDFYVSENLFQPYKGVLNLVIQAGCLGGGTSLKVYNSAGEFIRSLALPNSPPQSGAVTLTWDGTNQMGEACASGVYLFEFISPLHAKLRRVILIKSGS